MRLNSIITTEESNAFFTSDSHFYHAKSFVYEARGYDSVSSHNDGIIREINETVKETDTLFHLGDFGLNIKFDQFNEILSKINCQNIFFMWGNHNSCVRQAYEDSLYRDYSRRDVEVYPIRYRNLNFIGNYAEISINGQYMVLCHYPIFSWNYMKKGSWMLHGHEHSAVPNHLPDGVDGKILDVGLDHFKRPISFSTIKSIMERKNVKSIGHH